MTQHKKRSFGLWIIFALIAVLAVFVLFMRSGPSSIIPSENKTIESNASSNISHAAFGDMISINYVLTLENGTVVDTNNVALAQENNLENYHTGPFTFILGQSGKVAGFDDALLDMTLGEHRETTIEPSEKQLFLSVNRTKIMRRFITLNRHQAFPLSSYERFFKKPPVVGDVVKSSEFVFTYQVVNVTNRSVITKMVLREGEEYVLPNTEWKSAVSKLAENDVLFYQMPVENQTISAPFGTARINFTGSVMFINFEPELGKIFNKSIELGNGFVIPQEFRVVEIRNDSFIIERYGEIADKRLNLAVDLVALTKDVKKVKSDKPIITEIVNGKEN